MLLLAMAGMLVLVLQGFVFYLVLEDSRGSFPSSRSRKYELHTGIRPPPDCDNDPIEGRSVLDRIMVSSTESEKRDKILCFMMTHDGSHRTKVTKVLETWGSKCDGWLIASNTTDEKLGTTAMQTPAQYNYLWIKLNETVQLIASQYVHKYDWFFKVDDDTFVIMENLWHFLRIKKKDKETPQIFGYLLTDQFWRDQHIYFDIEKNKGFGSYFLSHVRNGSDKVDYLAGGSGYIMNSAYLRKLIVALESNLTLYGEVPEDMAHGATMLAHGIEPSNSRDKAGGEYFIPEPPALWNVRHQARIRTGVVASNQRCCAHYTVSFHHIAPWMMQHLYDQFYRCRTVLMT